MTRFPCLPLPLAAVALLIGLNFLRCIGADWNSTTENEIKGLPCNSEKENCTDDFDPTKRRSHFSRCPDEYKHYCVKGWCRYVVEVKRPACVCEDGYVGSRCELLDLYYLRGDNGQLVVIGLIAALVTVIFIVICTCACSRHCRSRRRESKKAKQTETAKNNIFVTTEEIAEHPAAVSVSVSDEAGQNILLNERKDLIAGSRQHVVH